MLCRWTTRRSGTLFPDKRGRQQPHNKTDEQLLDNIFSHIESFHPSVPHYKRARAPQRDLPSELTITYPASKIMRSDCVSQSPNNAFQLRKTHSIRARFCKSKSVRDEFVFPQITKTIRAPSAHLCNMKTKYALSRRRHDCFTHSRR